MNSQPTCLICNDLVNGKCLNGECPHQLFGSEVKVILEVKDEGER